MELFKYRLSTRIATAISTLLAIAIFSQPALAGFFDKACPECGTVTDVKTVKIEGEASGAGAVAGGVVGGVLGHQIGGGRGKDLATIGGVAGGAYVGHQMEKKSKARTEYRVIVEMENGSSRTFKYSSPTSFQPGDRVKIKNDQMTRP